MVYGLWLSADGLSGQQYRQDVIANNLANVETPGYKVDRVAFAERLTESMLRGGLDARHPILDAGTGGLFEMPVYTDYSQGSLTPTSNPFDVAVTGDGFLAVETASGVRYTRDGRMVMADDGVLRHAASGGVMLDLKDRPIVFDPAGRGDVKIDSLGRVKQGDDIVGRLALVDFRDPQQLEKMGRNLYSGDRAGRVDAKGTFRQFAYEASGVEPAASLVEMIAAARAYEMNVSMISMQDESLSRAVNEVGRLG